MIDTTELYDWATGLDMNAGERDEKQVSIAGGSLSHSASLLRDCAWEILGLRAELDHTRAERIQADALIGELRDDVERLTHESKWGKQWHRFVESIATILEVNSAGGLAELAQDIPAAIERLRDELNAIKRTREQERDYADVCYENQKLRDELTAANPTTQEST